MVVGSRWLLVRKPWEAVFSGRFGVGRRSLNSRFGGFGVVDFDVVEEAVFAGDAEFDFGFGFVGDAGAFQIAGGFAVDRDAHSVADGFDDHCVPLVLFEFGGVGDAAADEELGAFGFLGGVFHGVNVVAHGAVAFVDEGDAGESDL